MSKRFSHSSYKNFDPELGSVRRKKSLVRHDRARINDPSSMSYHYSQVVNQESDHLAVNPSSTGLDPGSLSRAASKRSARSTPYGADYGIPLETLTSANDPDESPFAAEEYQGALPLGTEVYGLNDEAKSLLLSPSSKKLNKTEDHITIWQLYCYVITFWAPSPLLKLFGLPSKERQFAWREKMLLISIILYIGAFIAYITFGFTATVCKQSNVRMRNGSLNTGYLLINGRAYDLTGSAHPLAAGITPGANILYPPINAGGKDASFLFQNVNGNCKNLITPRPNCSIPYNDQDLAWYMPCNLFEQDGSSQPNFTSSYYNGYACHTSTSARELYYNLKVAGDVYFSWDDIKNSTRNLVVYAGDVLDLDLINWFLKDDLEYPELFDRLRDDDSMKGHDVSLVLSSNSDRKLAKCLTEIVKVGVIDSSTLGCIASQIVLVVSLIFILAVVLAKFVVACYFKWVLLKKQGYNELSAKEMQERAKNLDIWSDDINAQGPIKEIHTKSHGRSQSRANLFNRGSRLSLGTGRLLDPFADDISNTRSDYVTMSTQLADFAANSTNKRKSGFGFSHLRNASVNPFDNENIQSLSTDIIHPDIVPQPPIDYEPYNYPLAHTICFVTCYSEDELAIRTTLDSIASTDFPNSHKLIFVVCDGIVKGSGNAKSTPEIALDMMTDFATPIDEVQPYSYVSVAQGTKRHNMAKVYAGFYNYDNDTIPVSKQQRVPMILLVKTGTESESSAAKPGNRGKRDSQVILMSFLQKVMFDERMTELEFEIFSKIWTITGLMSEMYEMVLMVDADTKVYPDSLTHMVAEMVKDPEIMGLCGETKISNKAQSWVTAIQVFEYYISHHQSKAFESVFGSVTCLPGCFSMYRIKAPKGPSGYWVPILLNPDIVERYSENVVISLHQKNLLLLGEDRFLSSLMLRTFPKRKQVFVPKAACKTVVPDTFKVLLSQRRRWINSTVHNLMELLLINDLCGTFCFSMQFVIGIELLGTLILPAAIVITIYVIFFAIFSSPTPVISLILLGIVFGLPLVLVVVTISNWMYIVWMIIYLFALPIWNFVLPLYLYWKFDDFSWGDTRKTSGDVKNGGHDDAGGEFDGSMIVQKRWKEFERDRRRLDLNMSVPDAIWDPSLS